MPERWEGYLKALERWGEPKDVDDALSSIGRPEEFKARHAEIKAMLESRKRWMWAKDLVKEAAAWIVGVGAAVTLIYGAYGFFRAAPPPTQSTPVEQQP